MEPPTEPPLSRDEATKIENLEPYAHDMLETTLQVITGNDEKFNITAVIEYGTFSDIFSVSSLRGKFVMRAEVAVLEMPQVNKINRTLRIFLESVNAHRDKQITSYFSALQGWIKTDLWSCVFMDTTSPNLSDIRRYYVKTNFPSTDAIHLSLQCFHAIQYLHSLHHVHGDICLSSFSMGFGPKENMPQMTHFGRMRPHIGKNGQPFKARPHVPWVSRNMVYAPRSGHKREDFGRRDDLESWLYITADLFDDGSPPWKPRSRKEKPKEDVVFRMKDELFRGDQTQHKAFFDYTPVELTKVVPLLESYTYESLPDYATIKLWLLAAKKRIGEIPEKKWTGHSNDFTIYPKPERPGEKERKAKKEKQKKERERQKTKERERKEKKKKEEEKKKEKERTIRTQKTMEEEEARDRQRKKQLEEEEEKLRKMKREIEELTEKRKEKEMELIREKEMEIIRLERSKVRREERLKEASKLRKKKKTEDLDVEDTQQKKNKKSKSKKKKKREEEEEETDVSMIGDDESKKKKKKKKSKKKSKRDEEEKTKSRKKKSRKSPDSDSADNSDGKTMQIQIVMPNNPNMVQQSQSPSTAMSPSVPFIGQGKPLTSNDEAPVLLDTMVRAQPMPPSRKQPENEEEEEDDSDEDEDETSASQSGSGGVVNANSAGRL